MSDVLDARCSGCAMLGMWNIEDMGCSGCGIFRRGTFGMWDFEDTGCSECGMFMMWDVGDVGCWKFGMWDLRCLPGCGMLIYKMLCSFLRVHLYFPPP